MVNSGLKDNNSLIVLCICVCVFLQTLLSENQGVVDVLGVDMNVQQLMCSAYQLLLQVLHTAFSWLVHTDPQHI